MKGTLVGDTNPTVCSDVRAVAFNQLQTDYFAYSIRRKNSRRVATRLCGSTSSRLLSFSNTTIGI